MPLLVEGAVDTLGGVELPVTPELLWGVGSFAPDTVGVAVLDPTAGATVLAVVVGGELDIAFH